MRKTTQLPTDAQVNAACEKRGLIHLGHASSKKALLRSSKVVGRLCGKHVSALKLGLEEWPDDNP